jgi:hypothetical protein
VDRGGRQELTGVESAGAPGRGGLQPNLGEREGDSAELTEGFFGRIDGEVKLAARDQGHDGFLVWTAC